MPTEKIGAKTQQMEEPIYVEFEIDDDINAAVERYGHEVVYSRYKAQLIIDLQAYVRSMIKSGKSQEDIQEAVTAWSPEKKAKGKSPQEKMRDMFSKLSPEERSELMEEFGLV